MTSRFSHLSEISGFRIDILEKINKKYPFELRNNIFDAIEHIKYDYFNYTLLKKIDNSNFDEEILVDYYLDLYFYLGDINILKTCGIINTKIICKIIFECRLSSSKDDILFYIKKLKEIDIISYYQCLASYYNDNKKYDLMIKTLFKGAKMDDIECIDRLKYINRSAEYYDINDESKEILSYYPIEVSEVSEISKVSEVSSKNSLGNKFSIFDDETVVSKLERLWLKYYPLDDYDPVQDGIVDDNKPDFM